MTGATEQRVREAAAALHDAITDARSEGLTVTWPRTVDDLPSIAVSETAKAKTAPATEAAKPKVK
ncbi:hypothetical protein [Rhizobium binae]|uniref:hypothetical protein n=1 Tax=Rhizobium binae TaxID=1138190 RepID=UPI001C83C928|nr:hypothetical protein [Rhizobium binae]MBX4944639.1 hypothetical protein [Rhizobium binae]MBX4980670.1 hypothetical protein [Rhizobium binae]